MNRTSFTIVADSISPMGDRLTCGIGVMHPRAVEHFLTHRELSRNGASRRAIPSRIQIAAVEEDDCFPAKWGREQKGMQSGEELEGNDLVRARQTWRLAKAHAVIAAKRLAATGLHKEVATAPIHPFMWRTYLVSFTNGAENFMTQRLGPAAQADIRLLAQCMDQALNNSIPIERLPGEWHLPFMESDDLGQCFMLGLDPRIVSAMRCARVSYMSHPVLAEDGTILEESKRNVIEDHAKGNGLAISQHWSPFEHQATPASPFDETANFRGWQQLRTQMGA